MGMLCDRTSCLPRPFRSIVFGVGLVLVLHGITSDSASWADDAAPFSSHILPLLSENCFQCHGPDAANREGGLRLDQKEGAYGEADSGDRAVVPGDVSQSGLFDRITSDDPDLRMPPPDSGKSLDQEQIDALKNWIEAGAPWSGHWSFQKPHRPPLPDAVFPSAVRNPIDLFIHQRLQQEGLTPAQRADKETLIRRVTLDLTGLPPTVEEIDAFLADDSPMAFERVVDRLLDSIEYGEQMARIWLDAARFADTHGLHLDNERSIWPYRDWVIQAFHHNMPFDQFTIEQIAGDLLPDPSLSQRVATGFNRCNVTTSEGGSIDDEYYVRYAVDRVETTSTVWLGLTSGCAACHDHKFDPLTQKEFYQLFSYFFSLTERAMDGNALLPPPIVKVPSAQQTREKSNLEARRSSIGTKIDSTLAGIEYVDPLPDTLLGDLKEGESIWFDDKLPEGAKPQGDGPDPWKFVTAAEHPVHRGENSSVRTGTGLTQHFFTDANPKLTVGSPGQLFAYVYLDPENPPETIQLQFNDGSWNHRAYWGADKGHGSGQKGPANFHAGALPEPGKWIRLEVDVASVGLKPESQLHGWAFTQFGGTVHWDAAGTLSFAPLEAEQLASQNLWEQYRKKVTSPPLPQDIQKIIETDSTKRSEDQKRKLTRHYLQHICPDHRTAFKGLLEERTEVNESLTKLDKEIPATLVMEDRKESRQAHVLERGEYTEKREPVSSAVPTWIAPLPDDAPNNRLGLAQWLVSPENPLPARVTVNRFWQHHFGTGLVLTAEDFGIQGEQPSHPALLDWLAIHFMETGWDIKRFHKLILLSSTYQQSSEVPAEKLSADPDNRLLARGPRFRLDAEVIRDSALAMSGLLVKTVGGKSVRPYQPAGLWKPVGFGGSNTSVFTQDSGPKLYRRSMYTFWKRTSPPPSMATFDAPDRETCQVRRARTNTPLQSLVLMNDIQFIEAARKLAERIMREGGDHVSQKLNWAFRTVTAREPSDEEYASMEVLYDECHSDFAADNGAAEQLLSTGESKRDSALNTSELAAWTMVAHLLLNLSETVTKG